MPAPRTDHPTGSRRPARRTRGRVALASLLALGALAAGCGDDDAEADAPRSTTSTTQAPASGDTVELTAVDYAFEDVPASIGTDAVLSLRNDSAIEVHELVAFLLPDDEERSAQELLQLPESELEGLLGGPPALVLVAPPSVGSFAAVGDGTLAEPGRYVLFCAIPTGADPDEYLAAAEGSDGPPEVDGGPPHFVNGMVADLRVD